MLVQLSLTDREPASIPWQAVRGDFGPDLLISDLFPVICFSLLCSLVPWAKSSPIGIDIVCCYNWKRQSQADFGIRFMNLTLLTRQLCGDVVCFFSHLLKSMYIIYTQSLDNNLPTHYPKLAYTKLQITFVHLFLFHVADPEYIICG